LFFLHPLSSLEAYSSTIYPSITDNRWKRSYMRLLGHHETRAAATPTLLRDVRTETPLTEFPFVGFKSVEMTSLLLHQTRHFIRHFMFMFMFMRSCSLHASLSFFHPLPLLFMLLQHTSQLIAYCLAALDLFYSTSTSTENFSIVRRQKPF
jgi:hypothetical protein